MAVVTIILSFYSKFQQKYHQFGTFEAVSGSVDAKNMH